MPPLRVIRIDAEESPAVSAPREPRAAGDLHTPDRPGSWWRRRLRSFALADGTTPRLSTAVAFGGCMQVMGDREAIVAGERFDLTLDDLEEELKEFKSRRMYRWFWSLDLSGDECLWRGRG